MKNPHYYAIIMFSLSKKVQRKLGFFACIRYNGSGGEKVALNTRFYQKFGQSLSLFVTDGTLTVTNAGLSKTIK